MTVLPKIRGTLLVAMIAWVRLSLLTAPTLLLLGFRTIDVVGLVNPLLASLGVEEMQQKNRLVFEVSLTTFRVKTLKTTPP